jgi:hypothetical protein
VTATESKKKIASNVELTSAAAINVFGFRISLVVEYNKYDTVLRNRMILYLISGWN